MPDIPLTDGLLALAALAGAVAMVIEMYRWERERVAGERRVRRQRAERKALEAEVGRALAELDEAYDEANRR